MSLSKQVEALTLFIPDCALGEGGMRQVTTKWNVVSANCAGKTISEGVDQGLN